MKNISIFILITVNFLFLLYNQNSNSQVTQAWVQRYSGIDNYWDEPRDLAIDKLGNVYVTGLSEYSENLLNYLTIKYNSSGVQQWVQSNSAIGYAYAIAIDDSLNVYVTGYGGVQGSHPDIITIKYNTSGVLQWTANYNGPSNEADFGWEITTDKTRNVYVTGWSPGIGTNNDYLTIKYNSSGVQQWVARYNSPANSNDQARSITVDNSGNVYVTGTSNGEITTIKYNSTGIQQWVTNGGGYIAYDTELDGYGNIYVCGYGNAGTGSGDDYKTIKYDTSGVQQWVKTYNGPGNGDDVSRWMAIDTSGYVYVTGSSYGGNPTYVDYATIKYNTAGAHEWIARYNGLGSGADVVRNIVLDRTGNVYVTGYSFVPTGGTFDFATVKYNGITGAQQWVKLYNGTGDSSDYGWALAVDSLYNIYVTGASFGNGTGRDITTIKYSQTIGIQQISNEVPSGYRMEQNYPNPFNPATKIKFQLPIQEFTKLIIYDVLGREVSTLVNENLKPGIYEAEWNSENYGSGVYFYTLKTYNFSDTKKMIVIK